jgi:hypothetical protein
MGEKQPHERVEDGEADEQTEVVSEPGAVQKRAAAHRAREMRVVGRVADTGREERSQAHVDVARLNEVVDEAEAGPAGERDQRGRPAAHVCPRADQHGQAESEECAERGGLREDRERRSRADERQLQPAQAGSHEDGSGEGHHGSDGNVRESGGDVALEWRDDQHDQHGERSGEAPVGVDDPRRDPGGRADEHARERKAEHASEPLVEAERRP